MDHQDIDERIMRDPAILVGKPVVRGTRIPVTLIVNYLDHGHTTEERLDDYPVLTKEDVEAAVRYVQAQAERSNVHFLLTKRCRDSFLMPISPPRPPIFSPRPSASTLSRSSNKGSAPSAIMR